MRDSTISVWKYLNSPRTIKEICEETKLSTVWVKKILGYMKEKDLVVYEKSKPIIAMRNREHALNKLLESYFRPDEKDGERVYYPGSIPFQEMLLPPDQIERILYEQIDYPLTVKDTGFIVKGIGREVGVTILESVEEGLTMEGVFLRKLMTTEGVEDLCVKMIFQHRIDYGRLLDLSIKKEMVNIVGCYLNIINTIKETVPLTVIQSFEDYKNFKKTAKKIVFLPDEEQYGKNGWEGPFEERWNVDIYLDLGAIRHGVRSA